MPVDDDTGLRVSRAAYRLETVPVLRQRLSVAMGLFVFFMGIGTFLEVTYYPARAHFAILLYGIEALVAIVGAGVCWVPGMAARSGTIAALTAVVLAACINTYHAQVAAQAERVATVLGCILNLLSVLLPWGWAGQGIAVLGTLGSFAVAGPYLVTQDALAFPAIVLVAAGTTSVWGAFFLDRYRFEAFRRTALQTEEAEIAAALAHVGADAQQAPRRRRHARAREPPRRRRVGCDWSSLFLFDERRRCLPARAPTSGSPPEILSELAQLEFPPDSLPLLQALRPGELVEIAAADEQDLVPPELLRRARRRVRAVRAGRRAASEIIGVLGDRLPRARRRVLAAPAAADARHRARHRDRARERPPDRGSAGGEPSQVGVRRDHVARAADAAERHHGLHRDARGRRARAARARVVAARSRASRSTPSSSSTW